MPTRKSALKRMRTDRKKGLANKSVRTELKTQAAKLLNLSRDRLRYRLQKHGLL